MITVLSDIGIAALALTGLVVLSIIGLVVLAVTDKPVHAPTQPSRVTEVGDDTLAMLAQHRERPDDTFLADGLTSELNRMLRGDGRG